MNRCLLRYWLATLLLACGLLAHAPATAQPRLVVLANTGNMVHAETVAALQAGLRRAHTAPLVELLIPERAGRDRLDGADLVITVGSQAARIAAELGPAAPTLHVLLPRSAHAALAPRPGSGPYTAIVLDQPVGRQIALIRLALPEHDRIATIASTDSEALAAELVAAAAAHGMQASTAGITGEDALYGSLRRVLDPPAVLVTTPDPRVFNSHTVQNVLLTAFRMASPVLGFSAAYVRAGAVIGLYTTASQAGTEAAELTLRVLAGEPLPPPAAPALFEIGVNASVARALGIELPSTESLTRALQQEEGNRP